jgi:hypothetical protein
MHAVAVHVDVLWMGGIPVAFCAGVVAFSLHELTVAAVLLPPFAACLLLAGHPQEHREEVPGNVHRAG